MAFGPTEVADCLIISKKFERGAIFSATPESAYAMNRSYRCIICTSGCYRKPLICTEPSSDTDIRTAR